LRNNEKSQLCNPLRLPLPAQTGPGHAPWPPSEVGPSFVSLHPWYYFFILTTVPVCLSRQIDSIWGTGAVSHLLVHLSHYC
jgi:hypothetical protein